MGKKTINFISTDEMQLKIYFHFRGIYWRAWQTQDTAGYERGAGDDHESDDDDDDYDDEQVTTAKDIRRRGKNKVC